MPKRKQRERRRIRLPDEAVEIMKRQLERFRDKFGREPGPTDPIFMMGVEAWTRAAHQMDRRISRRNE